MYNVGPDFSLNLSYFFTAKELCNKWGNIVDRGYEDRKYGMHDHKTDADSTLEDEWNHYNVYRMLIYFILIKAGIGPSKISAFTVTMKVTENHLHGANYWTYQHFLLHSNFYIAVYRAFDNI